jgi:Plavaka transposase
MPGVPIDDLMGLLDAQHAGAAPFDSHKDLYDKINAISLGDTPWKSFTVTYNGQHLEGDVPPWKTVEYEVWYHDVQTVTHSQLANPDFNGEIDYAPYQEFNMKDERQWENLMSSNWSWKQAVCHFIY